MSAPTIRFNRSNIKNGKIVIELRDHLELNKELIISQVARPKGIRYIDFVSSTGVKKTFSYTGFIGMNYTYISKDKKIVAYLSFVNNFEHELT